MKKQLILVGLLVVGFASAQTEEDKKYQGNVGINTMTPQTTLDIAANTADGDKVEGLMVPRITYAKMQAMKANLTEYHDGLMVYVTDYVDMNTGVSNGPYASMFSSPYFVYNAMLQSFVPFAPSGLTAVKAKNRSEPGYMLASKAVLLAHAASGTNENSLIGDGSIDMSSSISNIDIFARGRHSFSVQGGRAHGDYSTALGAGAKATGANSFATHGGKAEGEYSTALGQYAQATTSGSIALNGVAKGRTSFAALGGTSSGDYATSLGIGTYAEGAFAFAVAGGSVGSFARGYSSFAAVGGEAIGTESLSIGVGSIARGYRSFAFRGGSTNNAEEFAFGSNFNTDTIVETASSGYNNKQLFSVGAPNSNNIGRKNALIILRNSNTGIGLPTDTTTPANSKPTEMLDVNGNIKVRGTNTSITDGATCTNAGTISYAADGNFYGCTGQLVWKKLNN